MKCRAGFTRAWGITSFFMGELTTARERFEQSLALYRPEMHDSSIAQYGTDLGVAGHCYHALTLWHLGYPDQAVEESYRSITLAQDGAHAFRQAYALLSQPRFVISSETCPQRERKPR
jgi:hypothetical protein